MVRPDWSTTTGPSLVVPTASVGLAGAAAAAVAAPVVGAAVDTVALLRADTLADAGAFDPLDAQAVTASNPAASTAPAPAGHRNGDVNLMPGCLLVRVRWDSEVGTDEDPIATHPALGDLALLSQLPQPPLGVVDATPDVAELGEEPERLLSVGASRARGAPPQGRGAVLPIRLRHEMSLLTRLRSHARQGLGASEYLRALEASGTHGAGAMHRPPLPAVRPVAAPPPTAEQLATREHRVRLVAEDVDTGERVVLAERVPWRSLEVLGAAAKYYATHYDNPDRPPAQVRARRDRANKLGAAIWDAAEGKVGIEAPLGRD